MILYLDCRLAEPGAVLLLRHTYRLVVLSLSVPGTIEAPYLGELTELRPEKTFFPYFESNQIQ